jgi:hypothetical protein
MQKTLVLCGLVMILLAPPSRRLLLAEPSTPLAFDVKLDVVKQELYPDFCWFHPRVAAIPGAGREGRPAVVMTLQKHLGVSDHTVSNDGLHYQPIKAWAFDDGSELGSYNTQQHWLAHHEGLFLAYTRRGANNDHIPRNRAPIFLAQVDPERLCVIRTSERAIIPERGAMLGNFGAASINAEESWVTDAEYMAQGQASPRGANGSVFAARVLWSKPNALTPERAR